MDGVMAVEKWHGRDALIAGIDAVFFETSATRTFPDETARAAFRDRWLGRYLRRHPEWAYIASPGSGAVAGYLVGCVDDPGASSEFSDLAYVSAFAPYTRAFPAHLHVNVSAEHRGRGVGAALVERFARDAAGHGATGVHVVTARGMRNAGFYERNGFREIASTEWNGKDVILLARELAPPEPRR